MRMIVGAVLLSFFAFLKRRWAYRATFGVAAFQAAVMLLLAASGWKIRFPNSAGIGPR
jgi:hypothetical protein